MIILCYSEYTDWLNKTMSDVVTTYETHTLIWNVLVKHDNTTVLEECERFIQYRKDIVIETLDKTGLDLLLNDFYPLKDSEDVYLTPVNYALVVKPPADDISPMASMLRDFHFLDESGNYLFIPDRSHERLN